MSTRFSYLQQDYITQLNSLDDLATASQTGSAASATAAAASAAAAATSASGASTSATTSTTQATAATTQATNAATSATAASGSATSASTSAATATTQATNASTSATNAASSNTGAGTSATNAAASFVSIDKKYLGSLAADPTLDNQGAALSTGALFWNTVATKLRLYSAGVWIDAALSYISPAFTGIPTAPTAAALTNTTQLATTAFVKNAGESFSTTTAIATTGALTTTNLGQMLKITTAGTTQTFPAVASCPAGTSLSLASEFLVGSTLLKGSGAELLANPNGVTANTFTLGAGESVQFVSNGASWDALGYEAAMIRNPHALTNLLYPSADGQWRDIYRGGWKPAGFNQQWGGSQFGVELIDGATGNLVKFDVASGYVEDNNYVGGGDAANRAYNSQGIKSSEAITLAAAWLKLYKFGNPANNLQLTIVADDGSGTKPLNITPITNGTAIAQSGKLHTSKADGEWYRFVFPVAPSLVGGTQYHLVIKSSGAVDAVNYWGIKVSNTKKYPAGALCQGDATPVFSANSIYAINFLLEPAPISQFLQLSTGQFDSALKFSHGSPANQHKAITQSLRNFFDGKNFTALHRVSSCLKGAPIAEYLYGLDHDRISLQCNAGTGFASINFYDAAGTLVTVTGNTDVSVAGFSDVAMAVRTYGDGQDYLQLWMNGVKQAETTLGTYVVDKNMRELGTAWLGGGFALAPVWTQALNMASLPSALGFSWTGTAVEANVMSIQGGKLFQNANGYASTDTGYYTKTVALNNATGWAVEYKARTPSNNNIVNQGSVFLQVSDGTKTLQVLLTEYFLSTYSAAADFFIQGDFKSQENVLTLCGKGSDYYLYVNGKLVIDGTGKLVTASGTNAIFFGDNHGGAGYNADAIYSYLKYYQGGTTLPVVSTGMLLHEYAFWSGNKSAILPTLYNVGTPYSVKAITGMSRNYVDVVEVREEVQGVVSSPTTTSTTYVLLPDMELFVLGDKLDIASNLTSNTSAAANNNSHGLLVDGVSIDTSSVTISTATGTGTTKLQKTLTTPLGLHKLESRMAVTAGTMTALATARKLSVRSAK
jgi:hypothetical protein